MVGRPLEGEAPLQLHAIGLIPRTGEGDLAAPLLPKLRFLAGANQREDGARHDGDVAAANDFDQLQRVSHFFVAPLISAHHRDAQNFDLRRLDHHQQRLHVVCRRARSNLRQ